jgi:sulfur-oxidizing protein SoxY
MDMRSPSIATEAPLHERRAATSHGGITRREACASAVLGALGLSPGQAQTQAQAQTQTGSELSRRLQARREPSDGIHIELPELADSGHSVPLSLQVQAPEGRRIRQIEVLLPENPQPEVLKLHLPRQPQRQRIATRVRLAASQSAWVVVTLDDGSQRVASAATLVTASACLDDS